MDVFYIFLWRKCIIFDFKEKIYRTYLLNNEIYFMIQKRNALLWFYFWMSHYNTNFIACYSFMCPMVLKWILYFANVCEIYKCFLNYHSLIINLYYYLRKKKFGNFYLIEKFIGSLKLYSQTSNVLFYYYKVLKMDTNWFRNTNWRILLFNLAYHIWLSKV